MLSHHHGDLGMMDTDDESVSLLLLQLVAVFRGKGEDYTEYTHLPYSFSLFSLTLCIMFLCNITDNNLM